MRDAAYAVAVFLVFGLVSLVAFMFEPRRSR